MKMTKAIIYDTEKQEFVSKYGYKRYTKTVPFSVNTVCEAVTKAKEEK